MIRGTDLGFLNQSPASLKRKRGRPRRNDPERLTLLADQPSDREDRQHSAIQMDVTRAHNNVVWHNLTRSKEYGRHTGSLQNDSARCWSHRALSYPLSAFLPVAGLRGRSPHPGTLRLRNSLETVNHGSAVYGKIVSGDA